jgi:DNA repair protein RadC
LASEVSDLDVLEAVLSAAAPSRPEAERLAGTLLRTFGSFARVIAAPVGELSLVEGLDRAGVALLKAVRTAALRLLQAEVARGPLLNSRRRLMHYLHAELSREHVEELHVLFLDNRYHLLADEVHQRGTVNHTPAYPREIAKRALELNASALILAHNHPSGDPTPSTEDRRMTEQIRSAVATLSIELLDHVVVGNRRCVSFRECGLLADGQQ